MRITIRGTVLLALLWWSFDDYIAAVVSAPVLGRLPFWAVVLVVLAASISIKSQRTKEGT